MDVPKKGEPKYRTVKPNIIRVVLIRGEHPTEYAAHKLAPEIKKRLALSLKKVHKDYTVELHTVPFKATVFHIAKELGRGRIGTAEKPIPLVRKPLFMESLRDPYTVYISLHDSTFGDDLAEPGFAQYEKRYFARPNYFDLEIPVIDKDLEDEHMRAGFKKLYEHSGHDAHLLYLKETDLAATEKAGLIHGKVVDHIVRLIKGLL